MPANQIKLQEAKNRLDLLIAKARSYLYKPIAIAEILYRHRTSQRFDLLGVVFILRSPYAESLRQR
ncbi:MAG: HaeII family restriction endonuclease [Phycisphaerae bacterium]